MIAVYKLINAIDYRIALSHGGAVSGTAWKEVDSRRVNYHFVPYVFRKISEIRQKKQGM